MSLLANKLSQRALLVTPELIEARANRDTWLELGPKTEYIQCENKDKRRLNWRVLSQNGFFFHLKTHFRPLFMSTRGLILYDAHAAWFRGLSLQAAAEDVYGLLSTSNPTIDHEINRWPDHVRNKFIPVFKDEGFDSKAYKEMLARSLQILEGLDLASIDWDRVDQAVPEARHLPLRLDLYHTDRLFHPSHDD